METLQNKRAGCSEHDIAVGSTLLRMMITGLAFGVTTCVFGMHVWEREPDLSIMFAMPALFIGAIFGLCKNQAAGILVWTIGMCLWGGLMARHSSVTVMFAISAVTAAIGFHVSSLLWQRGDRLFLWLGGTETFHTHFSSASVFLNAIGGLVFGGLGSGIAGSDYGGGDGLVFVGICGAIIFAFVNGVVKSSRASVVAWTMLGGLAGLLASMYVTSLQMAWRVTIGMSCGCFTRAAMWGASWVVRRTARVVQTRMQPDTPPQTREGTPVTPGNELQPALPQALQVLLSFAAIIVMTGGILFVLGSIMSEYGAFVLIVALLISVVLPASRKVYQHNKKDGFHSGK